MSAMKTTTGAASVIGAAGMGRAVGDDSNPLSRDRLAMKMRDAARFARLRASTARSSKMSGWQARAERAETEAKQYEAIAIDIGNNTLVLNALRETTEILTKLYRGESVAGGVLDAIDSANVAIKRVDAAAAKAVGNG